MKKLFIVWFAFFVLVGSLPAQQTAPTPAAGTTSVPADNIKVRVDLVNVLITVTNKRNRFEKGLGKEDFRVFEDNKPQTIRYFSRETDLPLRIGVLIDTSASIRDRLRFEQEAAIDFLTTTLRPGKDLAFVEAFDVQPQMAQDYTDDLGKLSKAIRSLMAGGVTTLFDAIYVSCREKMLVFPPPEPYLRRVIIIISDGMDNQSEHTREEALAMAQHAEVTLYAISTNVTGMPEHGDKVLRRLAEQTGGRAFFPFKPNETANETAADFQQIARELRSQYSLAYVSTNKTHDGSFRSISIEPLQKGLLVRSKPGYFAPSE
ncbi:MAG TPA: VWA domain-containing protein [Terriglobia bacterium]|nr:VWA domain-containing protein [Terriglobia bacterium]